MYARVRIKYKSVIFSYTLTVVKANGIKQYLYNNKYQ